MRYSGRVEGGPYHGKSIHHYGPKLEVMLFEDKPVTYRAIPDYATKTEVRQGEYRYEGDRWVWYE